MSTLSTATTATTTTDATRIARNRRECELHEELQDIAEKWMTVRRLYATLRQPTSRFYFVYVLALQGGKLYVGATNNPYQRLVEHVLQDSALWVREHGPVTHVVDVIQNCEDDDETYITLMYMQMFGFQNVRGAAWTRVIMPHPPAALLGFERDPTRRMDFLGRKHIDDIWNFARAQARRLT